MCIHWVYEFYHLRWDYHCVMLVTTESEGTYLHAQWGHYGWGAETRASCPGGQSHACHDDCDQRPYIPGKTFLIIPLYFKMQSIFCKALIQMFLYFLEMYECTPTSDSSWWKAHYCLWEGRRWDSKLRIQNHWGSSYRGLPSGKFGNQVYSKIRNNVFCVLLTTTFFFSGYFNCDPDATSVLPHSCSKRMQCRLPPKPGKVCHRGMKTFQQKSLKSHISLLWMDMN